jgi:hypothetical protein
MSTWREKSAAVIARVVAEVGTDDQRALKKALFDAYPFGERQYHPYKIWCNERAKVLKSEPDGSAPMSVLEAQAVEKDIWNGDCLALSEMDCHRLQKLGDELDKCSGLMNLETVTIASKDAKFLRRLLKKQAEAEAA